MLTILAVYCLYFDVISLLTLLIFSLLVFGFFFGKMSLLCFDFFVGKIKNK